MPITAKTEGITEISEALTKLAEEAPKAAAAGLYEGAAVMRKTIEKESNGIKTAPFKYVKSGEQRLPSPEEKAILEQVGVGVAKFDRNGSEITTSVGYDTDGYADVNWNHMSSGARTNYKAQSFNGKENMTTSTLKAAGVYRKGLQNRKPVGVIANAINSGTSFMQKQPFFRKGVSKGTKDAEKATIQEIEKRVNALGLK